MVIASIAVTISWRLLQRMLVLINWGSRANARDLSASAGRPGHGDFARLWRYHSDPRIPLITAIFPIAATAAMQIGEALHQLDAHDVFCHLVAELPFEAQPQWRAVGNGQRLAVHLIGEDRLRMRSVNQVDALIVADALGIDTELAAIIQGTGAMEHDKAGLGPDTYARQHPGERHAGPFADAAPALDAIMAGDLGAGRQGAQLLER